MKLRRLIYCQHCGKSYYLYLDNNSCSVLYCPKCHNLISIPIEVKA